MHQRQPVCRTRELWAIPPEVPPLPRPLACYPANAEVSKAPHACSSLASIARHRTTASVGDEGAWQCTTILAERQRTTASAPALLKSLRPPSASNNASFGNAPLASATAVVGDAPLASLGIGNAHIGIARPRLSATHRPGTGDIVQALHKTRPAFTTRRGKTKGARDVNNTCGHASTTTWLPDARAVGDTT
jgi:hypothetical protein